jgi:N-acetylmuramate 1-kinase
MTTEPLDSATRERIEAFLGAGGRTSRRPRIVPLTPDASDRRYFRAVFDEADSVVLAVHAGPIEFATMPFANVAALLNEMGVRIPRLVGHSDALGIIAQEDLGDVTLQAHVGTAGISAHAALYQEAIDLICRLQERGRNFGASAYTPYGLAFDVEKLTFELNFFERHFLEAYRGIALTGAEKAALGEEWSAIVQELADEPRVVCHRDYHSRNLMFHHGRLYVIDFQDARMGPDTYDLASLLRDSYVDITPAEVDRFVLYFASRAGIGDLAEFRRRFDLMAVQRNLKALGTFGFQASARHNPAYIEYMPRTLRSVRDNMAKYSRFERLQDLLAARVDELR